VRLALYVCLKNICDGVGGQDVSNGTPLDPPLFWLDNIFNMFYWRMTVEVQYCVIGMARLRLWGDATCYLLPSLTFQGPKSLDFQGPSLPMALEMYFPASKSLRPEPYKQQVLNSMACG
jgi:hypothetical protein